MKPHFDPRLELGMGTSALIWRSCIEVLVGRFVNLILDIVFPILR